MALPHPLEFTGNGSLRSIPRHDHTVLTLCIQYYAIEQGPTFLVALRDKGDVGGGGGAKTNASRQAAAA